MKQKDILFLLISTFIIVILWIIFSIYHNSVSSTISKPITIQIIPINPDFDTKTIEALKKREKIAPIYNIEASQATQSSIITATPTPIPTVVPTASPIVSPIASPGANQESQNQIILP